MSNFFFAPFLYVFLLLFNVTSSAQSKYQTPCQQRPEYYGKLLDELEKKVACLSDLSPSDCHALFLTNSGALATAGALAAREAFKYGKLNINPEDLQCRHTGSSFNIFDLFFPKAYAVLSCSLPNNEKQLVSKYLQEAEKTLKKEIASEEARVKEAFDNARAGGNAPADLKTLTPKVEEYIQQLETSGNRSQENAANKLRQALAARDEKEVLRHVKQSNLSLFNGQSNLAADISAQAKGTPSALSPELVTKIETLFNDRGLNNNDLYKKLSDLQGENFKALEKLNIEEIVNQRARVNSLRWQLDQVLSQSAGLQGTQDIKAFARRLQPLSVSSTQLATIQSQMAQILHDKSLRPSINRLATLSSNVAQKGLQSSFRLLGGTVAMGASLATFAADVSCREKAGGSSARPLQILALNYIKFDESQDCKIVSTLNENSFEFFKLSSQDRINLIKESPELCQMVMGMTQELLAVGQNKVECNKDGFTLINKINGAKRNISVNSDNYKVQFSGNSKTSADCQVLTINAESSSVDKWNKQCNKSKVINSPLAQISFQDVKSATQGCTVAQTKFASTCSAYVNELKMNLYDYAQISKCCSGNSNDYCELSTSFNKTSSSSGGSHSGSSSTGGTR